MIQTASAPQATAPEPFPGAKPYDEEHRDFFFGREDEANEVTERVFRERITILTGESASGKTSLVRAGIIPQLRFERSVSEPSGSSSELQAGQPRANLTLVLRDWGGGKGPSAGALIRAQLPEAIDKLKEWSAADYALLHRRYEQMATWDDISDVLTGLAETAGGLILVLDQFEEVLRARKSLARELIEILRRLHQSGPRVRLLLSLREEYHKDLRELENIVGPLYARTYFLKRMDPSTVEEAIHSAGKAANVQLPKKVVRILLNWLAEPEVRQERGGSPAKAAATVAGSDAPDLLRVQTVVRELVEFCRARKGGAGKLSITKQLLDEYRGYRTPKEVVGRALERWISDALKTPAPGREGSVLPQIAEPAQTGLAFRIAARLAPFLSSGDYKVAQEEADLFRSALREDLASLLGLEDRTLLQQIAHVVRESGSLFPAGLKIDPAVTERAKVNLAAAASEWGLEMTLRELFLAFRQTLERLHERNIVKPLYIADRAVWELVHDGFARPFWTWSEENRETWNDCRSSLVACRGVSPILITTPIDRREVLQRLNWLGCLVKPAASARLAEAPVMPRPTVPEALKQDIHLEGLRFEYCNLRGTIFDGCTFSGTTFHECFLDGTVFLNCRFLLDEKGAGVRFENCDPNSLGFLNCQVESIQFENCTLRQATFAGLSVAGSLRFTSTALHLALFEGLRRPSGEGRLSFEGNYGLQYCAWDETFETMAGEKVQEILLRWPQNGRLDSAHSGVPTRVRERKT